MIHSAHRAAHETTDESRAVVTVRDLEHALSQLGASQGDLLVVHASISSLGYVIHGVQGVYQALRAAVGPTGTIMVPTFTGEFSDPSCWVDPPLPRSLWEEVRSTMPTFDKARSLPVGVGQLSMAILADSESVRSDHPLASWAAVGPLAGELVEGHDLEDPFGPGSPLGRARELNAQVLLMGVDQRRNSAVLHAHCLSDVPAVRCAKGPFLANVDGKRRWVTPRRLAECTEGYGHIEDELVVRGIIRCALCGDAKLRLMSMDAVVTEVELILNDRPDAVHCGRPTCRACASAA